MSGAAFGKRMAQGFGCKLLYSGPRPKPEEAKEIGMAAGFGLRFVQKVKTLNFRAPCLFLGAEYVSLDELLGKSDIVSVHTPLTENTRY